jgi:hypothetical protein
MRIVELIIDEKDEQSGIDAISVVMSPAIESNFIHLSKHEILLKEVDAEKRILMGAALIPDKQIYRKNDKTKDEYYIYFSKATIRKASELFLMNANQNNSTLEHSQKLKGMSVVESWIIEGENDKSKNYGFDLPKGTWMISMKVNNDEIWDKVKLGEVKGFSIEGYFADRYEMNSKNIDMEEKAMVEKIKELITKSELAKHQVELSALDNLEKKFKVVNAELSNELNSQISKINSLLSDNNNIATIINKYQPLFEEDRKIRKMIMDLGLGDKVAHNLFAVAGNALGRSKEYKKYIDRASEKLKSLNGDYKMIGIPDAIKV